MKKQVSVVKIKTYLNLCIKEMDNTSFDYKQERLIGAHKGLSSSDIDNGSWKK